MKSLLNIVVLAASCVTAFTTACAVESYSGVVMNPSCIPLGQEAWFCIKLNPPDFPDNRIVWSATDDSIGSVTFPNGNTGRSVMVHGVSEGAVTLNVQIGDSPSSPPQIKAKVLPWSIVHIQPWIVGPTNGTPRCTEDFARTLVNNANVVFRQAAMFFVLDGFHYTNRNEWAHIILTNGVWRSFRSLINATSGTGCLEVYFVDRIDGANGLSLPGGIAVSADARANTLAHEIGHACGLDDIYVSTSATNLSVTGSAHRTRLPDDWNNGTGDRYYASGTTQAALIRRLIMFGVGNDEKIDIPLGSVYGLHYDIGPWNPYRRRYEKIWRLGLVPVGVNAPMNRNPVSR